MIDDLWYKNGVFYCLSVGTYMDANGDGVAAISRDCCVGSIICTGSASPRSG
ncbi:hypothetical protein ACVW04_007951 [Bradyrhizobium sp. LM2.3]